MVKLFNAIRAAQNTTEADLNDQEGDRKSTSTKNEKGIKENTIQANAKRADNPLGGKAKAGKCSSSTLKFVNGCSDVLLLLQFLN